MSKTPSVRDVSSGPATGFHRSAAVLSVGDELLLGQIVDTNSAWLGGRLAELGVVVREHAAVGDDAAGLTEAIERLAARADLLLITGGLGPTADDLTRAALSSAAGDVLVEDAESLARIESWFRGRGREMPATNRVQALRPSRGEALANQHGTAPGVWMSLAGEGGRTCDVVCVPGPPPEMRPMFESEIVPRLRIDPERIVITRSLHCIGIGESDLAVLLGDLMNRDRNPLVGTNAGLGRVTCRVRYEGAGPRSNAEQLVNETEAAIRGVAGDYVFGAGDESIAEVVVRLLRDRKQNLGVVESCTGGLIGGAVTSVAGSSDVFVGGLLTYSNAMKERLAGVPPGTIERFGAVSEECGIAMAEGGCAAMNADWCIAVTGIAGPGGAVPARDGIEAKPVGTVYIAVAGPGVRDCRRFAMRGDREAVRGWSVQAALAMIWLHLVGRGDLPLLRESRSRK